MNGAGVDLSATSKGYLPVSRTWQNGDVVNLNLPMNVRRTERAASSRIALLLRIEGPLECRLDLGS